jgi:hypothetical protein
MDGKMLGERAIPSGRRMRNSMSTPLIRAQNLEIHEVPDGYIVYQTGQDRVHYLNKTAAIIFEFCTGSLEADDVVARMTTAFDLNAAAQVEIRASLDTLVKEGLVLSPSDDRPRLSSAATS